MPGPASLERPPRAKVLQGVITMVTQREGLDSRVFTLYNPEGS